MKSDLRERLGPRVQVRAVDKFSGSNAAFFLISSKSPLDQPVDLAQLLVRCGLSPSKAKNTVERLIETGSTAFEMPSAPADIQRRLAVFGVKAVRREAKAVDVAAVRLALGMTQEEFAAAYGFSVATIRNWEQHRSEPDAGSRAFLTVIETHPAIAAQAVTA
jgi:DNA-binding transcriptional regulator YiaG